MSYSVHGPHWFLRRFLFRVNVNLKDKCYTYVTYMTIWAKLLLLDKEMHLWDSSLLELVPL